MPIGPTAQGPTPHPEHVSGKLQGRPGITPPPVSKRQARRKRAKRRRKRLQDGSTPLSFLSAFGHMTLRDMDTRAVVKGVHTLGLDARYHVPSAQHCLVEAIITPRNKPPKSEREQAFTM